jgi:UPF0716 protein FxsA
MFFYLVILFTVLPVVELVILIRIGQAISVGPTLGIIILTGVVGAALAKHQGLRTLARIQRDLAAGEMPTGAMVDGMLILVAGAVLITPGVITDALGFCLLIPFVRARIRRSLRRYFEHRIVVIQSGARPRTDSHGTDFIDVEAEDVTPPSDRPSLDE